MSESAQRPRARLSPFVLPSDTTFRFALLVVAVLGANLYIWNWLWIAVGADQGRVRDAYLDCTVAHQSALAAGGGVAGFSAATDAFSACIRDVHRPLAWWMLGGTALLLAVAAAIVLVMPRWIVMRRRLRPLEPTDAPELLGQLRELAQEAGLEEEPRWMWNPLAPAPTGLAFGRPGRHTVALTGGLVTRQITDPPAFRSVVRHELAHLRNRDVSLTYATVSLWYAFLLVSVLPFAIVVFDEGVETVLALGWRLVALAGLVYLTRNAVLRAREVYADVRASVPDGPEGALRRILAGLPRRDSSAVARLRSVHPDPQARIAALDDTRRLFPLGLLVAFGAGVAATVAYESLVTFIGIFVDDPLTIRLLAAVAFAPLAMGVVGVGVWRGAWGALAQGGSPPPTWPLALAVVAGFVVGPELALERAVRVEGDRTLLESALGSGAPWIAALLVGVVLLLAWVGAGASDWIRSLAGATSPDRAAAVGLVVSSGLLAALVGVFYTARDMRPAIGFSRDVSAFEHAEIAEVASVGPVWLWQLTQDGQLLVVIAQPAVFLALVALWLFPLAAWVRRRRAPVADASWAFLDPGGRLAVPPLGRAPLTPLWAGLAAGAVFVVVVLVLRLGVRNGVDAETRAEFWFPFAFFFWQFLLALVAQGAAGTIAAARAREAPLIASLGAAFVAGVIASAVIAFGPSAAGCVDSIALNPGPCAWTAEAGFTWMVLRQVVVEGALVALAAGVVVAGVQAVLRRRYLSSSGAAASPPPAPAMRDSSAETTT